MNKDRRDSSLALLLAFAVGFVFGSVAVHIYIPTLLTWSTQEAYLDMTEKSANWERSAEYWKDEHDKKAQELMLLQAAPDDE